MTQSTFMPQIFYCHSTYGNVVVVAAKIADDIFISGILDRYTMFISSFKGYFTLVSVASRH